MRAQKRAIFALPGIYERGGYRTPGCHLFELIHISEEQKEQIIKPLPPTDQEKIMSLYERILQKGMLQGIEKEKIATVLRGHKEGISPKVLCVLTGLTEKEVSAVIARPSKKKG